MAQQVLEQDLERAGQTRDGTDPGLLRCGQAEIGIGFTADLPRTAGIQAIARSPLAALPLYIPDPVHLGIRSEEHTFELQPLMRPLYAAFCLKQNHTTYQKQT